MPQPAARWRSTITRVPFVRSLTGYRRKDLSNDLVAAVLITATAIPLGIGFATAAGLPPMSGLYTSMAPLILFGLFSSTRQVKLGLDAAAAAMIGSAVVPLAMVGGQLDTGMLQSLVAIVSVLTGLILLIAGALRAGFLADLLSLPLLVGYQAGIAISVIIGQIPKMLGLQASGGNDIALLGDLLRQIGATDPATAALGIGSLAALLLLRRWRPAWPGALILLVVGTLISAVAGLSAAGVAVIGELPAGLPSFVLPDLGLASREFVHLLGVSASLALVVASDVVIASRTFAARGHYPVSANVDVAALGLAQIGSGLTGGATASASYARTAITERAGSKTQLSSVFAGLLMMVVLALLTGYLAEVPLAVLGAICVDACIRLVEGPAFAKLWRLRRSDFLIAVVTGLLVLLTDPLLAIAVAVGFSVLSFLRRAIRPEESRLGRRRGINGWFALNDYADAQLTDRDVVIYRWDGPLIFANAGAFQAKVAAMCAGVDHLVVDCSAIFDIDPSALAVLEELADQLTAGRTQVIFVHANPVVARILTGSGLPERLGPGPHLYVDIDTAMAAIGHAPKPPGELSDPNNDGVYEYVVAQDPKRQGPEP